MVRGLRGGGGGGADWEAEDAPREAAAGHGECDDGRRSETWRAQRSRHVARSALEVLSGDDIGSDGDETLLAEEEVPRADGAVGKAAEEVKAEPAPDLGPAIKREPSDNRRQQQQKQPTCVRSAKRRAVWARGGAGGPSARVEAGEAAAVEFAIAYLASALS